MECGWEGRIQRGHFSPSQQACDWLPSVYYLKQKLVGGVPITPKTVAAFNRLNVHPHTTDKWKMSPSNTKTFQKRCSEDYCLLVRLGCSGKTQRCCTVPGPDDSRSQWRRTSLHSPLSCIKPKQHIKVSKAVITSYKHHKPKVLRSNHFRGPIQLNLSMMSYTPVCHHT